MQTESSCQLRSVLALIAMFATTVHAADFTVANTSDSGAGSLREAISAANDSSGPDTIEFAENVAGTITLVSALPPMVDDVSINGPGAAVLTVSGDDLVRPFSIAAGVEVLISGLTVTGGFAPGSAGEIPGDGGGIRNDGTLEIRNCIVSGNASSEFGSGGGIFSTGTLLIQGSTITLNTADLGAGIASGGSLEVVESTIRENAATAIDGGISNAGTATIRRSLIASNVAEFGGGIGNAATLTVVNSTISGNAADGAGGLGGGIDNLNGSVELLHATIARNQAPLGGGVSSDGELVAKNSLLVENTGGDCEFSAGSFDVFGVNLDTDGSCNNFTAVSSGALALQDLADNGGPTATHAIANASVAVNAALDCTGLDGITLVATDQRGVERPRGAACEPGAFESDAVDLIFANGFE